MRLRWSHGCWITAFATLVFGCYTPLLAQKGAGGAAGGAGSGNPPASTGGAVTRGTTGPVPTPTLIPTTPTEPSPNFNRPIFLSGRVMLDDGSPANTNIRIERVCGGHTSLEAHTDSKGRFSFQVGQNQTVDMDASDEGPGFGPGVQRTRGMNPSGMIGPNMGVGGGMMNPLWNCELRASYPGYLSDTIDLANRRSLGNPDVGTIVLHHLSGNVKGSTISITSVEAPKKAQKDYKKGLQFAQKGDLDQAEKRLEQAVDIYPRYAAAWFALGQAQEHSKQLSDARNSYLAAIKADSKYVSPYDRLALLSASQNKWQEAADYSQQAIDLNPIEYPSSFWYNAIANYNLHNMDQAQKSAAALVKLDVNHKYPEAERLLAQISLAKNNYADAGNHLRAYLQVNPNAKDADALKQTLLKIDQASTEFKQ